MSVTVICKGLPSWPKEPLSVDVESGWTIADVLFHAGITKKKSGIVAIVNGRLCRLTTPVTENDEITIYPRMGGG